MMGAISVNHLQIRSALPLLSLPCFRTLILPVHPCCQAWLKWKECYMCIQDERKEEARAVMHEQYREMWRAMKSWHVYVQIRREKEHQDSELHTVLWNKIELISLPAPQNDAFRLREKFWFFTWGVGCLQVGLGIFCCSKTGISVIALPV